MINFYELNTRETEKILIKLAKETFSKIFKLNDILPENLNSKKSKFTKKFNKEIGYMFDNEDWTIWNFKTLYDYINYITCRIY